MILAGVNALAFHFTTYRSVATWDTEGAAVRRQVGRSALAGVVGRRRDDRTIDCLQLVDVRR